MEGILIPVKESALAKGRLSRIGLHAAARRRLHLAMLADVLRATEKWDLRLVVTSDLDAEAVAIAFGCELVGDPWKGLNDAVAAGTRAAIEKGCTALIVLPCDVPLVSADDLRSLISAQADVAVVSSPDGGTNALLRRPPAVIDPAFGPHSARAHLTAARDRGLIAVQMELESLRRDIDGERDLAFLATRPEERESIRVARELIS